MGLYQAPLVINFQNPIFISEEELKSFQRIALFKEKLFATSGRRNFFILLVVTIIFVIGNYYILQKLTKEEGFFNPYIFLIILNIDVVFLLTILAVSLRHFIKLFFEGEKAQGKLRKKLSLILISMVVIPSMILSIASISILSDATKVWFSGKVETALERSKEIIQKTVKDYAYEISKIANLIADKKLTPKEAIRYFDLEAVIIVKGSKKEIYGRLHLPLEWTVPKERFKIYTYKGIPFIRVYKIIRNEKIVIDKRLPEFLYKNQTEIKFISDIYSEFKKYRSPVRIGYILTMLTITMFVIFAAIWFSQYIVRNLTSPIEKLAEAAKRLASGDLDVKVDAKGKYEIGILIDEFNHMTQELKNLYFEIEKRNKELKYKNEYLEAILENARTGVIYSDRLGHVEKINKAAINILEIDPEEILGKDIEDVLRMLNIDINKLNEEQTIQYKDKILILKLTKIANTYKGYVLVFDDITDIVQAQKILAWKEIAQRIAHEIKNPLTPIKLSAERILRQYEKGNPNFKEILEKSVDVIIKEVNHLSNLVKEFGQFASASSKINRENINLSQLFKELKEGYETENFHIELNIQDDVEIIGDRKLLKQAFSNIIQNAYEATEGLENRKLQININKKDGKVVITFHDNGKGINKEDSDKIFNPYFSKKTKGTGLGLAITKEIIESHDGSIKVIPNSEGAVFIIELPISGK